MLIDRRYDDAYQYSVPPKLRTFSCMVAILALMFGGKTLAQNSELRTYGDPSIRTAIDVQLKRIYELATGPGVQIELLTRDNPLQLRNAVGTELSAAIIDGSAGRIVGTVWTKRGKYAIEFYRVGDKLIMVYETFSFFVESAPRDTWHNFMGLPAWESRIYYGNQGEVGYAETHGSQAPAPEINGTKLQQEAEHLDKLLHRSSARWERRSSQAIPGAAAKNGRSTVSCDISRKQQEVAFKAPSFLYGKPE